MPHVQVVGSCDLPALAPSLAGFIESRPPLVMKIAHAYVSLDRQHLLLEAMVVEGYLRQAFFLLVRKDETGLIIRCHPTSPVQKTDGVKTLIARLARTCLSLCPGSRVGHTNLAPFIEDQSAEAPPE